MILIDVIDVVSRARIEQVVAELIAAGECAHAFARLPDEAPAIESRSEGSAKREGDGTG